ncbi:hypothetical protein KIMH_03060 [Bombiscardovia apis]|uniref:Uncharacterized protein n=1 Tax=Bombiscardovia apis TaxID=2932182 RepID=A0ABN6SDR8_9BIFI|nr:leucine-rich repeat domain-containing protein [Bombiscardovia apis]BDR54195.1 hypothetical protein KIMH_03060 [Bombiscardovia apis]
MGGGAVSLAATIPAHAKPATHSAQPLTSKNASASAPARNTQPATTAARSLIRLKPRGGNCTIDSSSIAACIPDSNLADKIATTLNTTTSATLTTTLINSLVFLEASHAGITNVEGIQHFTNLEKLHLSSNQITDLSPVTGLPRLTTLNAVYNQITTTGPLNNPNLESLDLYQNQLTNIASINWNGLSKLEILRLEHNQLIDISPVTGLPNLIRLSAPNNLITTVGDLNNPNLTVIELDGNKLTSLASVNWNSLTKLETLKIGSNQFTNLSSITGLPKLTYLHAFNNKINDISSTNWNDFGKLRDLNLSKNKIPSISALTGLTDLTRLYVEDNQVTNLGSLDFPNIELINLSRNKIPSVASVNWNNLTKLQKLYLDYNQITDFSPVTGLSSLTYLTVFYNRIVTTSDLNFPNLTYLNLGSNKLSTIAQISWGNLTKLQELALLNNQITDISSIDWSKLTELQKLHMSFNQITDLSPVTGLSSLTYLNASYNQIVTTSDLNFPNLTELSLSSNKLSTIAQISWGNLTKLRTLNLDKNDITDISSITWNDFTKLHELTLDNNQITDLSSIDWSKLTSITEARFVEISDQKLRLPDAPGYADDPLVVGPATTSTNTYATPAKNPDNSDKASPAGGTYHPNDGTYTWERTYPGDYQYSFTSTVTLPYASATISFDGTISQHVPGYAVLFDPNGGTLHTPKGVPVLTAGSTISAPSIRPSKSGDFVLLGWYTHPTEGIKWDFDTMPVNGNMTLYARWTPAAILPHTGTIPLQQWSGSALLAMSVLTAAGYAIHKIKQHRSLKPQHTTKRKQR